MSQNVPNNKSDKTDKFKRQSPQAATAPFFFPDLPKTSPNLVELEQEFSKVCFIIL